MRATRHLLVPTLAVALVIGAATAAEASLFLEFDRTSGRPGTIVHVHTAGDGACVVCPPRLRLWFAEASVADEITSPDDPRLVSVGGLRVDTRGNARGRLTVPLVPHGRYLVQTDC